MTGQRSEMIPKAEKIVAGTLSNQQWHPFVCLRSQRLIKRPINVCCLKLLGASLPELLWQSDVSIFVPHNPTQQSSVHCGFMCTAQSERHSAYWKQSFGLSQCEATRLKLTVHTCLVGKQHWVTFRPTAAVYCQASVTLCGTGQRSV